MPKLKEAQARNLSERDICTKFITPALEKAGWDTQLQILEEVSFTDGKIYVRGKLIARGKTKRADYILYYKPNIPIAIIEAKDNNHSVRAGIQQALDYAQILDIPCVFSSNGEGFLFHNRTATDGNIETEIGLDDFPTPEQLWEKYKKYKGISTPEAEKIASQEYYFDGTSGTTFRQAINKLNEIGFNSSKEHHIFNVIYEDILQGLATKKDTGEFYTPRAVTQFVIDIVNPQLGEKITDPACGTAGFLVCAIEHLGKQVKNINHRKILQETITGTELKPLPFMLSVVNLITHDIEVPQISNGDSLSRQYTSIKQADRVDIIVANPPFGGVVGDGMETNFPLNYRTKESADLFLILFIQLLKDGGRAGIVLPDGSLTGEGVKQRVRQKLLEDCNVHTIVRLPQSVFAPYATVNTNLIFFEKGKKTKDIWYYEHTLPEGVKAYSKTKPIRIEEFEPLKVWWSERAESEVAWKVPIKAIIDRNYDLDIKNPNKVVEEVIYDRKAIIEQLEKSFQKSFSIIQELKNF